MAIGNYVYSQLTEENPTGVSGAIAQLINVRNLPPDVLVSAKFQMAPMQWCRR